MSNIIQINNGVLTTNTWLIAKACKRRHFDVMTDLKKEIEGGQIDQREFSCITIRDHRYQDVEAIELTESGFLSVMPYICGRKGRQGQRALVQEFVRLRQIAGQGHKFLQMDQKEQASIAGRGLANFRWHKPVFDCQLSLSLDDVIALPV